LVGPKVRQKRAISQVPDRAIWRHVYMDTCMQVYKWPLGGFGGRYPGPDGCLACRGLAWAHLGRVQENEGPRRRCWKGLACLPGSRDTWEQVGPFPVLGFGEGRRAPFSLACWPAGDIAGPSCGFRSTRLTRFEQCMSVLRVNAERRGGGSGTATAAWIPGDRDTCAALCR
jgi:hypothetical protein